MTEVGLSVIVQGLAARVRLVGSDSESLPLAEWSRCLLAEPSGDDLDLPPVALERGHRLQRRVTLGLISGSAGLLMWHAGAVAAPDGRVVALVAPSGGGKSTAVAALARHGWGYVTDETLGVSTDGIVAPYPKPLAFRRDEAIEKVSIGPDQLGLAPLPAGELKLARLLILRRDPQVAVATVRPMALLDAVLELVASSSSLTALPSPLSQTCAMIRRCGGVFEVSYADASQLHVPIQALVADTSHAWTETLEPWASISHSDGPSRQMPGTVVRAPFLDGVATSDEVMLLVGSVPIRLSGIGASIWLAAERGIATVDIPDLLVRHHGQHARADQLANEAVHELLAAGVLVESPPVDT